MKRKIIWIFAAALLLAALALGGSILLTGSTGPAANALRVITTPLRNGMASVAGWLEDRYNYAFRYNQLAEENEALRQRIAELEEAARVGEDAIQENELLRELIGLTQRRKDLDLESATITARGATNWASTLTLSKGSNHGVEAGDCVIDQYGNLVGVVTEVSYNSSVLITVVDAGLEMGGLVARTDSAAIIEGDFAYMIQGKLKLTYLPENTQLLAGDQVLTSGMGGVYPAGLVVGTIDEVLTEPSGMGRYAVLTPAAALNTLREVFIIKDFDIVE